MDGTRFDALTRSLARSGSRRRLLGGLLAGAVGLLARHDTEAASCRPADQVCREHSNCCSGTCRIPDRRGRRYCDCRDVADCYPPGPCRTVTCVEGSCVTSVTPGADCTPSTGGTGICQGTTCVACQPAEAPCADGSVCCSGFCTNQTCCIPNGESCEQAPQCCSGNCAFGTCEPAPTTTSTSTTIACIPDGENCTDSSQCCPGTVCDTNGTNTCQFP